VKGGGIGRVFNGEKSEVIANHPNPPADEIEKRGGEKKEEG